MTIDYKIKFYQTSKNPKIFTSNTNVRISEICINLITSIKTGTDLNQAADNLTQLIREVAAVSTPRERFNNISIHFIAANIKALMRRKRNFLNIWQRTRQPAHKAVSNQASNYLKIRVESEKNTFIGKFLSNLSPKSNEEQELWIAKYLSST